MRRGDGSANTGCINWPTHLENPDGMGSYVMAIFPSEGPNDDFVMCWGANSVFLMLEEPLINPGAEDNDSDEYRLLLKKYFPDAHDRKKFADELSIKLLAALCLGSSGGLWRYKDGRLWACKRANLTEEGKKLIKSLEKLYKRKVVLLTFIDT